MWESLAGALILDGGWDAINCVLVPLLTPYICFYHKYHEEMDLNIKGQALDIMSMNKDIKLTVTQ